MNNPIEYLKSHGLRAEKAFNSAEMIIYHNKEEIGRYSLQEATHYGMRDVTPQIALEEYIKPLKKFLEKTKQH